MSTTTANISTPTMTATALLTLTQWLSPAFPTGAFAYSHGLEAVIAAGTVQDVAGLEIWLSGVLRLGAGWQDAVLLAAALRPGADFEALDTLALIDSDGPFAPSISRSVYSGRALRVMMSDS